jgi:PIN domain nuclease of toxin-antitoxin system
MRLLLDTHALIWWLTDNHRLSTPARAAIADPDKQRLGRLSGRIAQDLPNALREARIPVHALTLAHTIAAGLLPGPHRDPWDRLIMAQALTDDLTVITVDPVFQDYALPICW